jgi:hypothetical protein
MYCIDAPQKIVTKSLYRTAPPFLYSMGRKLGVRCSQHVAFNMENLFGEMSLQTEGNGYGLAYSMSWYRYFKARKKGGGGGGRE